MKKHTLPGLTAIIRTSLLAGASLTAASALLAQPTDNPVLSMFPASGATVINDWTYGDYSWTDDLNWSTVYDVTTDLAGLGLTNVTKDDLPPNHPKATASDITGDASDDLANVQAAIDYLELNGGGVLYFPAGTYIFSDNIELKTGVVLRGATPANTTGSYGGGTKADARDADYDPPTDFYFPRLPGIIDDPDVPDYGQRLDGVTFGLDFFTMGQAAKTKLVKKIEIEQTFPYALTATNYGIVNIDINRAAIDFIQRNRADDTIDKYSVLFGSDHKNRMEGGNVVVFGCRINNVVELEWDVPDPDMNAWQIWTNRNAAKIDVMVKENAIIANNRISDNHWQVLINGEPKSSYPIDSFGMPLGGPDYADSFNTDKYLDRNGALISGGYSGLVEPNNKYVLFRQTNGQGILANRSSRTGYNQSADTEGNPAGEPSLQRKGVVVRQNWVFQSNRPGYSVAGYGVEVRDNVKRDRSGETNWLTPDGLRYQINNSATYENRGIDLSGFKVLADGNETQVFRRAITTSGYSTIDGEGLLIQPNDGSFVADWTLTNNTVNSYIGIYKIERIRNLNISGNTIISPGYIQIQTKDAPSLGIVRNLTIDGNTSDGGISIRSPLIEEPSDNNRITITNNTAPSIEVGDYNTATRPTLNDDLYVISGNSVGVTFDDSKSMVPGGAGDFPDENVIDPAPVVEILTPAPGDTLTAGVPITVEVQVTVDESVGANTLESVYLYDCSQLDTNQQIGGMNHRTDANSVAGRTQLTCASPATNGSGLYTASWTPSQDHIDFGLFVIDAKMTGVAVTKPDGTAGTFSDATFGLIGMEQGVVTWVSPVVITVAMGVNPELSFATENGKTYQLQKSTSMGAGSWSNVAGQSVPGDGTVKVLSDPAGNPGSGQKAFYRVVVN
ncbi:MAG: glycosyl hydrolase family 28-related protein [Oceanipulchritudo sp.]